jgi:hypothetical protein
MDWIAVAQQLGIPTGFGAAILFGAWHAANKGGAFLAPLVVRLVEATEKTAVKVEANSHQLATIHTTAEWSHEKLMEVATDAAQDARRAATAAEQAVSHTGQLLEILRGGAK